MNISLESAATIIIVLFQAVIALAVYAVRSDLRRVEDVINARIEGQERRILMLETFKQKENQ